MPLISSKAAKRAVDIATGMLGQVNRAVPVITKAGGGPVDDSPQARAAQMGFQGPWYHGTARLDRLVGSGKLDPKRATSGPMPFFTDNPKIASNYATGKQDTSLAAADSGDVKNYFTVHPKHLGWSGRREIPVEDTWGYLHPDARSAIAKNAPNVGYERPDEQEGPLKLHDQFASLSSPNHYEYLLKHHRGNHLSALRDLWMDSGALHGDEDQLAKVYRLAGYPHPINQDAAPWTESKGILPAMLKMKNPLHTSDTDYLKETVIPHLEQTFKRDRTQKAQYGADWWDKRYRHTPKEWTQELKAELERGKNPMTFTSIPDKVTDALRALGHDGIIDTGGKLGGAGHTVAIPFEPHQVRSVFAKFDPKHEGSSGLLKARGGGVDAALRVATRARKK